ncbi:hypothetical protein ACHAO4_001335 [Trichoderma viride]
MFLVFRKIRHGLTRKSNRMPRYNPQWENQIKGYRKNRVLLVAKSLPFNASTTQVESAIRARLTKPDSAIFLWPPGANRPDRHIS